MFGNQKEIPVYMITGFLDSGKTTFLNFTIHQPYFQVNADTLLIACEEGEVEYDANDLALYRTSCMILEAPEEMTYETLRQLDREYHPSRVIIEYNPLWGVQKFLEMKLPKNWVFAQNIVIVDAETFQVYQNNMKSIIVDMVKKAELVLFNRCDKDIPLANFRRSIKVVNPGCDVQYADKNNAPIDIFEDNVPYDLDQDIIQVEDVDYGIFYVDMRDHPDRYKGKKVRFKAMVLRSRENSSDFFMPARPAMTCCAEDIQYIGYICKTKEAPKLKVGKWVEVTARVDWKFVPQAQEEQPVLQAITIRETTPPEIDLVYFN